jgi:hypothetical protein
MSDIVVSLRQGLVVTKEEAADEIERLRDLLRDILPEMDYANPELDASDRIITLRLRERIREALGDVSQPD